MRPGDWTCNNCGANVFASKLACFRCHTPKPGFEAGNMSNGGPPKPSSDPNARPGDWTCNNCGANVFASKTSCYRCHAPKPSPHSHIGGLGVPGDPAPLRRALFGARALACLLAHPPAIMDDPPGPPLLHSGDRPL